VPGRRQWQQRRKLVSRCRILRDRFRKKKVFGIIFLFTESWTTVEAKIDLADLKTILAYTCPSTKKPEKHNVYKLSIDIC
jgi:hypothetical protein